MRPKKSDLNLISAMLLLVAMVMQMSDQIGRFGRRSEDEVDMKSIRGERP